MIDITTLLSVSLMIVAAVGTIYVVIRKNRTDTARLMGDLTQFLAEQRDLITTSNTGNGVDSDVLERLEKLERRMEQVHSDSLKYLQKAAAAEQRAKAYRQQIEDDDETGMTEEEARALLQQQTNGQQQVPNRPLTVAELEAMADRG